MLWPPQVSLDQEVILDFLELQDRVLMVHLGRMVFQELLDPRAYLEMSLGPRQEVLEGMVHLDSLEIRVYQGSLEDLDYLVGRKK